METKHCGECKHFHLLTTKTYRHGCVTGIISKEGKCGLGYHNASDPVRCRVFKDKDEVVVEEHKPSRRAVRRAVLRDAAEITGAEKGRFTTNPWEQWRKKE